MTANEAKELANKNREGYVAGLLSHYLKAMDEMIQSAAHIGKNNTYYVIPPVHYDDVVRRLSKELRKLGFKVSTEKKHHKIVVSWSEEEENGLSESTQENS